MEKQKIKVKKKYPKWVYLIFLLAIVGGVFALGNTTMTGFTVGSSPSTALEEVNSSYDELEINAESLNSYDLDWKIGTILNLRKATLNNNLREIARNYDALNIELENSGLWRIVADCSYNACNDKDYLNLMQSIVVGSEDVLERSINSVIKTTLLWEGRNEALFSQELTRTDNLINENFERLNSWEDYLDCNCPGNYSKVIAVIEELASKN